ncbi:MAG: hypothetical protein JXQ75_00580 [Phycisphaerae bacterium]|nr:hypothetical protein [Phycisphaerae bacterium]
MEVHGQSDVAKPDEVSAATSLQADSVLHDDPLADASCLHCGYSLRGLTENRCPECGTPFDPQEMASSYLPEWPRLMRYYLTGLMAATLLVLAAMVAYARLSSGLSGVLARPIYLGRFYEALVTICLAPLSIAGLRHRVDWGRKAALALFLLKALPAMLLLVPLGLMLADLRSGEVRGQLLFALIQQGFAFAGPPAIHSLILIYILWTGLKRSLRRSTSEDVRMLPLRHPRPRRDWLSVLVFILAAGALRDLAQVTSITLSVAGEFIMRTSVVPWSRIALNSGPSAVMLFVTCGWSIMVARRAWQIPSSAARRLKSLLVVSVVLCLLVNARWLITASLGSFSGQNNRFAWYAVGAMLHTLSVACVPLALYLYASRVLPAEAIARVTEPPQQPTGAIKSGLADG